MVAMKGNLVTLEPLDIDKHAKGYFAVSQDENMHRYTGNLVPKCVDETVKLLQKYEQYFYNWMIVSNESHDVIGIIRLSRPDCENGVLTAGESQFLSSAYWRKGHMKEAKKLFYRYVFGMLSVDMLYADVWEGNINSMRSLEHYGYKLVETQRAVFSKTGQETLKYIYVLTKEDYLLRAEQYSENSGLQ